MKIKIIKSILPYVHEGMIVSDYSDAYCKELIDNGIAESLEKEPIKDNTNTKSSKKKK